ncbi:hypothetical protein TEA_012085 [Camellia sinensis var. sinensis]|uniref:Translation initiation factor 3 C-terminal domain-containing protein n=1 Tax=Camellia sinensis var. sinensis TaxID=542762 RepID=A0A4S4EBD6_CAMSN|nr:hypothetical protein TEA_012085 [Camellia sinensis var. sinensis]
MFHFISTVLNRLTSELMGYNIDVHDYTVRLKAARKFLNDGDKVKIIVNLKGRENEFRNNTSELIKCFQNDVGEMDVVRDGEVASKAGDSIRRKELLQMFRHSCRLKDYGKLKADKEGGAKNVGEENLQEARERSRNKGLKKLRNVEVPLEDEPDIFEYSEHTFEETNSNRIKWRQRTKGRESVIITKKHVCVLTHIEKRNNRWISNLQTRSQTRRLTGASGVFGGQLWEPNNFVSTGADQSSPEHNFYSASTLSN